MASPSISKSTAPTPPEVEPASTDAGALEHECDACGKRFAGPPPGSGLLVWTRGDEVRYEEPPLCESCAEKVATRAMMMFSFDDEDE